MQNSIFKRVGKYVVRPCGVDDLNKVVMINFKTLPEHYSNYFFEELLQESPETFVVAEREGDGKVVGYIMCRVEYGFSNLKKFGLSRKGHVVSVAVFEEDRGKGLGRVLVEEALKGMKSKGCSEAYLEVRSSNTKAVRLYEKMGFEKSVSLEGYYRDGEAAVMMVIKLNQS